MSGPAKRKWALARKYKVFKFKETDDSLDFALPERINELIVAGKVKYYDSFESFKNRKR